MLDLGVLWGIVRPMKSRGRPKGPEKVVIKMRVPKGTEDKCRTAVYLALGGCVASEISGAIPEDQKPLKAKESAPIANPAAREVEELKSQIKALLVDIGETTKERDYWKGMVEDARLGATEPLVAMLRAKLDLANKRIKELENQSN